MRMIKEKENISCLSVIIVLVINAIIGAWSIIEILSWFGQSIPMVLNFLIGVFTAEISVPIAIIGWILRLFGLF